MSTPMTPAPVPEFQPMGPTEVDAAPATILRAQKFLASLRQYWWVPAMTLGLGLGAALSYALLQPPTFVSRARMWETVKLRLPEGPSFSEDAHNQNAPNFLSTQTELFQSTTLRNLALARLRATSNNAAIPIGKDGEPLPVSVRAAQASKSAVFVLEASGPQAAYTRAYLDALMDAYLDYKKNVRKAVSGDTLASITEQVQKAERDLKSEQEALTVFQRSNNLAILEEEGKIAGGYLARLKTQVSDLQLEDRLLQAALQDVTAPGAATNKSSLHLVGVKSLDGSTSSAVDSPEPQVASKELELLKMQREKLSLYLRPKHPKMLKLQTDIDRAEKMLEVLRRQNQEQLTASRATVHLKMENVETSIREWEGKVVEANSRIAEAERLKLNVQRIQNMCDRLTLLVQNVDISRNIDQETFSILEPASPPTRSYSKGQNAFELGGVGGLGLGLGLVLLLAVRDDRFTSVAEICEKLNDSVFGQVPEMPSIEGKAPLLLEEGDEQHMYAESFRSLRSALLFVAIEGERPKILLVTSALPNEGKSTVTSNLARTMALGGARVLLVDGDLRRGVLHELMGMQQEPGLAELLIQDIDMEDVIQKDSLSNLGFIGSGARLSRPGDLFLGVRIDQLLARWRKQYDYVIIDSSPIFAADDTTTLAPKVDGVLFVVRSRFSGAREVREALDLLHQRQAKVLGLVFNRANTSSRSYHYYKYAGYYAPRDQSGVTGAQPSAGSRGQERRADGDRPG